MQIIIGLGNPGSRYADTWHNLGFISVDRFAAKHDFSFRAGKGRYYAASGFFDNKKIVIVKPSTYMNLSGTAVSQVIDFYGVSAEDIIVIYDDINLNMGNIRLRESGSAGGHNGIKSIINSLDTMQFNRVRIGFRTDGISNILRNNPEALPDLVLAKIPSSLADDVNDTIDKSVSAVEYILEKGMKNAMNNFNSTNTEDKTNS
ncbi:MAG: aminoacyl-tRNA hydrolase [Candidatus Delongbacteria bacterium]|nr:aminoacyl-tRNA hydrolase [Candidatus Delongbacteria bacterium]